MKLRAAVSMVLVLLSAGCGIDPGEALDEPVQETQEALGLAAVGYCANNPPVAGYVVTKITSGSTCTPYFTYWIETPSAGAVMCSVPSWTVPGGWVVTEILSTSNCTAGGIGNPAYWGRRLYQPVSGIVVCASSPTPAGWYRSTRVSTGKCNGEWGYVLRPL